MINISIISIGKNCAPLVAGTISSVLSQKLNGVEIEYIVVDGLSTDGTLDEVTRATNGDSRVRVISEADRGISDAMNKGARLAIGQLIFHLHFGDLLFEDNIIAKVWADYQLHHWHWAAGTLAISKDGSDVEAIRFKPGSVNDLIKKNCVPHQATFITRALFLKSGGFDVGMRQAMDYDLWLRLAHVHKECLHVLPFIVAKFDSSGESTKLIPLLKGNAAARTKMIRQYGTRTTRLKELLFYSRIIAYWVYYRVSMHMKAFR
ncbi:glycosyltransferase [Limnobacter humi]|uniref:Glycosyltransferase n=1 Tax=Limnobacter humi TaxID=1778671 RepID=A0ABT1WKN3_9BURK|nr:glycosyltransferase [Limnobacter humi]MCQ8897801.1 glycosyltransferase [Limnobacter humi]